MPGVGQRPGGGLVVQLEGRLVVHPAAVRQRRAHDRHPSRHEVPSFPSIRFVGLVPGALAARNLTPASENAGRTVAWPRDRRHTGDAARPAARDVPARAPGSVRRTMHVDVGPARRVELAAGHGGRRPRPAHRAPDAGGPTTCDRAGRGARDGRLRHGPAAGVAGHRPRRRRGPTPLIGTRAGGGFRRHLDEVVPAAEAGSLLRQVLDDMPAAALISGYASCAGPARGAPPRQPHALGRARPHDRPVLGLAQRRRRPCVSIAAGHGRAHAGLPARARARRRRPHALARHGAARAGLDAPPALHRRAVDDDGTFAIWAMFRDTVGEGDGDEVVLHEYAVTADGRDGVLGAVVAEPRVLPFPECPAPPTPSAPWSAARAHTGGGGARHADRHPVVHPPERPAAGPRRRGGPGRAHAGLTRPEGLTGRRGLPVGGPSQLRPALRQAGTDVTTLNR